MLDAAEGGDVDTATGCEVLTVSVWLCACGAGGVLTAGLASAAAEGAGFSADAAETTPQPASQGPRHSPEGRQQQQK